MPNHVHIVIVEPSVVIRRGLVTLLREAINLKGDILELSEISSVTTTPYRYTPDIIIASPSLLQQFSPSTLRSNIGNDALKLVALQSSFIDRNLLRDFDEAITIYDSAETIIDKITTIAKRESDTTTKIELSQREKEVIICVVKGMTNKQIADSLHLSTHTVIAHRRNAASKLQIHSPAGLTIYAIVNNLVVLSDIKNSITANKD